MVFDHCANMNFCKCLSGEGGAELSLKKDFDAYDERF